MKQTKVTTSMNSRTVYKTDPVQERSKQYNIYIYINE